MTYNPLDTNFVPFLQNWKTSVGFTVFGLILWPIVTIIFESHYVPMGVLTVISVLSIGFMVAGIIYAAVIYPSLFTERPKAKSAKAISFANAFFGGLIFGLCWNSNLTKRSKGVAHSVFIVLEIVAILMIFAVSYLAGSSDYI